MCATHCTSSPAMHKAYSYRVLHHLHHFEATRCRKGISGELIAVGICHRLNQGALAGREKVSMRR